MKRLLLGCLALVALALPAQPQTNKVGQQLVCDGANANTTTITVKDAAGATQTFDVVTGGTARCATVKAASTAAAAADLGLVVSMSPNGQNVAWAGGTLGAMANYGTSPGAVLVPGVNSFITNAPSITNITGTVSLPTGAATSALQGTNTATTAHTCSVAGYSLLGCLGQIDDDVKSPIAAGTAIIGKVGIDQTTPGTTNGVAVASDSSATTAGTVAVAGTTASNVVGKASAGNLQNAYVTSSAAGWVFLINATSLPANATLTIGAASGNLQGCFELQKGNVDFQASINYNPGPWEHFSSGIVVAISSTDCPVLTAAATGKFIHAQVN